MDRRDFLAFIPSISSIPFLSQSITDKSDRIEIIKPEIINPNNDKYADFNMIKPIEVMQNGNFIGRGYVRKLNISNFGKYDYMKETEMEIVIIGDIHLWK